MARLVSILAVYDRSRVFFDALSHKKGHIFGLRGSLWRVFGSNTEKKCTERSCFMYEKVLRWFWWSVVPIVALHFGRTCVLQLPSVWSKEVSVLANQVVQEGSGACNFFSNGYCGQVLCMWTGVVALGAGLRHDEVAYRHLSFASCRCFSVVFSIHTPNTRNACVLWRQLLPRFHNPPVFTCSKYYVGIAPCESASSYVAFG